MQAIDMHSHYWPKGILRSVREGTEWYGWRADTKPDGSVVLRLGDVAIPFKAPERDLEDPDGRIASRIQAQGIDFEALMVVGFLWNHHLDAADGVRFANETNEELAELERAHPDRFRGLGVLPMQDADAAMESLRYAVEDLGMQSFALAGHVNERNLDDPDIMRVIERMIDLDVSISVHPPFFDKLGEHDRLAKHYFKSSMSAPIETSIALMSLLYDGLLDRRPEARLWFTHGGGIVPYTIGRFATRWNQQRVEDRPTQHSPEYYLDKVYVGCLVHDDASLRFLIDRVGSERITLGTDHPFSWDHPGGAGNWIRDASFLSEEERENILWRNAARFLRIPIG